MTVAEWLFGVMAKLGDAGVDSPRRDALVLLEDTVHKDRSWVLAHPEHKLDPSLLKTLDSLIARRMKREPLAYIRGKAWFYKRFFDVNPRVLIPRPESESFIELLKDLVDSGQWAMDSNTTLVDIGTGSGAFAITTKLEWPEIEVLATDLSAGALIIAKKNALNHKVEIKFLRGSLLEPLQNTNYQLPAILLANLPYVPDNLITSPEIKQEPPVALFSGTDGMDHYRKFWQQIANNSQFVRTKYVLTESLVSQHVEMEKLASVAGYTLVKTKVLVQLFRR